MRHVINGQIRVAAVKWYLLLKINFCKSTNPGVKTDSAVMFHSEMFKFIDTQEFDYQFRLGYNEIVLQIDEFQRSDGGCIVDHFQHLDLGT